MIVSIQKPDFLPDIAYFDRIYKSKVHVFLDTVRLPKRDTVNRANVLSYSRSQWIIVPLSRSGQSGQMIRDARIDNRKNWKKKLLGLLHHTYRGTPYFEDIFPQVKDIIETDYEYIAGLNIALIERISQNLQLRCRFLRSSELNVSGSGNEHISNIMRAVGGRVLLAAESARDFLCPDDFKRFGIDIEFHSFVSPEYNQNRNNFIPGLSVLDVLCHCSRRQVYSVFQPLMSET